MLRVLAHSTLGLTALAFCGGAAAPVGLLMSLLVQAMARHDLRLMKSGIMDPTGHALTTQARRIGFWTMAVNAAALAAWGMFYLIVIPKQE
jgi:hypothetical protein